MKQCPNPKCAQWIFKDVSGATALPAAEPASERLCEQASSVASMGAHLDRGSCHCRPTPLHQAGRLAGWQAGVPDPSPRGAELVLLRRRRRLPAPGFLLQAGCKHVTCRNMRCRMSFCWICRGHRPFRDHSCERCVGYKRSAAAASLPRAARARDEASSAQPWGAAALLGAGELVKCAAAAPGIVASAGGARQP